MKRLDIYPDIWDRDGDEGFAYIAEYFGTLRSFIDGCVAHDLGMVVCLC